MLEWLKAWMAKVMASTLAKAMIVVVGVALVAVVVVWSTSGGDDDNAAPDGSTPGQGDGDGSDGGSGEGADGGSGGDSGDGSGGSNGAGGSGSSGSSTGDGDGSDGGSASYGGPGMPAWPPPPGGFCGPQEFLGGLIPFVQALGKPDLIPGPLEKLSSIPIGPIGPIAGPIGGALAVPANVLGGFNNAYGQIADELPSECASITGDPHVRTLDGRAYDFQAIGEYWALRSSDGELGIQLLTMPYRTSLRASTVMGVATEVGGRVLVVDETADDPITVDGRAVDDEEAFETDDGGAIIVLEDGVAVYWPDGGTTMTVSAFGHDALSVHVTVGEAWQGDVRGLLGNADGDPGNDLTLDDGEEIDPDFDVLYGPFRESWRVDPDDVLFDGPSRYRDNFPNDSATFDLNAADAQVACVEAGVVVGSLLDKCIFDVAILGDVEIAEVHLASQRDRVPLVQQSCELELDGDVAMTGYGPDRRWSTGAVRLIDDEAWMLDELDEHPLDVGAMIAVGDRLVVTDMKLGLLVMTARGRVELTVPVRPLRGVKPLVVGDTVFVATQEGLAAVGLDGSICWHLLMHDDEAVQSLGLADDAIVVTTMSARQRVSNALVVDIDTGSVRWSRPLHPSLSQFGAPAPPVIDGDTGYFEGVGGGAVALDLATGDVEWTYERDRPAGTVYGISRVDDILVVAGRSGGVVALDRSTGEPLWEVPQSESGLVRGLATHDDTAVLATERAVRGVSVATGEIIWSRDDVRFGPDTPQPVVAGDHVLLYAIDRQILALSVDDGSEVARIDADLGATSSNANGRFAGEPVPLGRQLVTFDRRGTIVAYG